MGVRSLLLLDRRKANLGPPRGRERRKASKVSKMTCPWCGHDESAVYRSRALVTVDGYRRRRQCSNCLETYPTLEEVDWESFQREDLAPRGLTLADIGFKAKLTRTWRTLWRY